MRATDRRLKRPQLSCRIPIADVGGGVPRPTFFREARQDCAQKGGAVNGRSPKGDLGVFRSDEFRTRRGDVRPGISRSPSSNGPDLA